MDHMMILENIFFLCIGTNNKKRYESNISNIVATQRSIGSIFFFWFIQPHSGDNRFLFVVYFKFIII
jgi:hypothetical protein